MAPEREDARLRPGRSSTAINLSRSDDTHLTDEGVRLLRELDLRLQGAEVVTTDALTGGAIDPVTALWAAAQAIQKARLFLRGVAA